MTVPARNLQDVSIYFWLYKLFQTIQSNSEQNIKYWNMQISDISVSIWYKRSTRDEINKSPSNWLFNIRWFFSIFCCSLLFAYRSDFLHYLRVFLKILEQIQLKSQQLHLLI